MTIAIAIQGIMLYGAWCYKLWQLARAPRDVPLRVVTLCLTCAAVAFPLQIASGNATMAQTSAGEIVHMWLQILCLSGVLFSVIVFFLLTSLPRPRARVLAWRHSVPLLVAMTGLALLASEIPPGLAPAQYPRDLVSLFYLIGDLYCLYALVVAYELARRQIPGAGRRLARGMRMTATGAATMGLATVLLLTVVTLQWVRVPVPDVLLTSEPTLLVAGIVLFVVGLSYPGLAMRIASVRVWWERLKLYHGQRPLWIRLHRSFPEKTLGRAPLNRWRDILRVRGIHWWHYRRMIECRDGLVGLSPYVAHVRTTSAAHAPLATQITAALWARADGVAVPDEATPVAAPEHGGLAADAHALRALSQELKNDPYPGMV